MGSATPYQVQTPQSLGEVSRARDACRDVNRAVRERGAYASVPTVRDIKDR